MRCRKLPARSSRPPAGRNDSRQGKGQPSQRQLKVGEQVRHVLAESLVRGEVHDTRLQDAQLTVLEVRMSPDLRQATVFISQLGHSGIASDVLELLKREAGRFGGMVARRINLKYAPKLRFLADDTLDRVDRIEQLLDEGLGRDRRES
ncbi:MAG: 30S ribosome-binding factor RbfA [Geminicoccaceae bacterium]|nr:30S ribosome-binding factor RbfA [Geminicoccaceae bacterium]